MLVCLTVIFDVAIYEAVHDRILASKILKLTSEFLSIVRHLVLNPELRVLLVLMESHKELISYSYSRTLRSMSATLTT